MYYNDLNEVAKQPALLASLAGLINPATIVPAAAIGAVCLTAIVVIKGLKTENQKLLKDREALETNLEQLTYEAEYEEIEEDEPLREPLQSASEAVNSTVPVTAFQPLNSTANNGSTNSMDTAENMSNEALQKEMIRQTMSMLGKKSAAARARKRQENA